MFSSNGCPSLLGFRTLASDDMSSSLLRLNSVNHVTRMAFMSLPNLKQKTRWIAMEAVKMIGHYFTTTTWQILTQLLPCKKLINIIFC